MMMIESSHGLGNKKLAWRRSNVHWGSSSSLGLMNRDEKIRMACVRGVFLPPGQSVRDAVCRDDN